MSRGTAEIAVEVARFLPANLGALSPVYGGIGAAFDSAEAANEAMADSLRYGLAAGKWLDLLALGAGQGRQAGETDAALAARLQSPPEMVTRPLILDAVNALLATYGADEAVMIEWWEGAYMDSSYMDSSVLTRSDRAFFVLIVPLVGSDVRGGAYMSSDYMDSAYMGVGTAVSAVYAAIISLVNQIKAAGVLWKLLIDVHGVFT